MKRITLSAAIIMGLAACAAPEHSSYDETVAKTAAYYQDARNRPQLYWVSGGNPLGSLMTRATLNRDSVPVKELRDQLRLANKQEQIFVIAGDNDDFAAMVAIEALKSIVGHLENLTLGFSGNSQHLDELQNLALGKGIRFNRF